MRAYTVHAPPGGDSPPERFAFVKDGFCWPALFVPILWILWRRLWLTLVWYVAWLLALAWVGRLAGEGAATLLALVGAVFFAFEANDIRRRSLRGRGWRDIGASSGGDLDEAEIRFFGARAQPAPLPARGPTPSPHALRQQTIIRAAYPPRHVPDREDAVLGLFPEAER
jgi:hypothetical protein